MSETLPLIPEQIAKVEAETRKLDAEIAREVVEAERLAAETAKLRAEAREATARAEKEEHQAVLARLTREESERKVREALAVDRYHHLYRFDAVIEDDSVGRCINALTIWQRLDPGCDIEVRFTSPGGLVIEGLALFDFIRELSRKGHRITTAAYGYAASMAGILLQAGDVRVMARESWLLIHEPSAGAVGTLGEMVDRVEWLKRVNERIIDIFFERSRGGAKSISRAEIKKRFERKDWWLTAEEAFAHGFVDDIR